MSSPRVVSLGCRLNSAESEVMKALAAQEGLNNALIINTCAVTAEAERQAKQTIRRLRKENPEAYIIATGCAVQLRPKEFDRMPEINRVIGNNLKTVASSFSPNPQPRTQVGPLPKEISPDLPPVMHMQGKPKAFLQIQNGCDHYCTFCTIALARGRSRSVPLKVIITQVEDLLSQGVQEVVLTGVDLTSYRDHALTLGGMVQGLLKAVPNLKRLRLSSLDSIEVTPDLCDLLIYEKRILPHVHLSLQAGSNEILQAMKRRHFREEAITLCQTLRKNRPEIAIGADFIAGFPGETEEMFQETMDLVDQCDLVHLHVFPYSQRPGTPAARMPHQVSSSVIKERAARLRQKGEEKLTQWLASQNGSSIQVLVEQPYKGHADDFSAVQLTEPAPLHTLIRAEVISCTPTHLVARPLAPEALSPSLSDPRLNP